MKKLLLFLLATAPLFSSCEKNNDEITDPETSNRVSKLSVVNKEDELDGLKPSVMSFQYNEKGQITQLSTTFQEKESTGIKDYSANTTFTYTENSVTYTQSFDGEEEEYGGTAVLNEKGYVASTSSYGDNIGTREINYDTDWSVTQIKFAGGRKDNIQWSNGNLTTLTWGTSLNKEQFKYSDHLNNKINIDLNWILYPFEGTVSLDGSNGNIYAVFNLLGIRSKNYISEASAEYGSEAYRTIVKYEYEFDSEKRPVRINTFKKKIAEQSYTLYETMTVEYM